MCGQSRPSEFFVKPERARNFSSLMDFHLQKVTHNGETKSKVLYSAHLVYLKILTDYEATSAKVQIDYRLRYAHTRSS
jgi:hypothetical protein